MLNIYTVAFFGHRHIENALEIEEKLEKIIYKLMNQDGYIEFLVGRNGEFDNIVSSVVHRVKEKIDDANCALILVLPYPTSEYKNNVKNFENYFDSIEISHKASLSRPKASIGIRNREMADRADLIICYIEKDAGGAVNAVEYAKSKGKKIVNLAN